MDSFKLVSLNELPELPDYTKAKVRICLNRSFFHFELHPFYLCGNKNARLIGPKYFLPLKVSGPTFLSTHERRIAFVLGV